jgi:D-alanine-D-alanine ligase
MNTSSPIRVAVLRGGPSHEYSVSLHTGQEILKQLPEKYIGVDIFVDKDGVWHMNGVPKNPEKIFPHIDVVFNALHGHFGEDGKVQHILSSHGIPHTGSHTVASAFGMNKYISKSIFERYGIKTPVALTVEKDTLTDAQIRDIFTNFPHPSIVKPVSQGSSIGIQLAHTLPELADSLEKVFAFGDKAIIEEYIQGREATCGVIAGYRDESLYALPVIEIKKPQGHTHYSFEHKTENTAEFDHLSLTPLERAEARQTAVLAHKALGLGDYSRADMIIHPKRGVFLLESNSQPGLSSASPFVYGLTTVGAPFSHFLDHVITRALKR